MNNLFEEVEGETVYSLFEENKGVVSYGITVKNNNDYAEIHDITTIYQRAYDIYETLVRNAVSPVHTGYIVTDLIS